LYIPDGLAVSSGAAPDYPYADDSDLDPAILAEEQQDDFEEQLIDAMTTPIKDEDSASAVVPLIIRGPAELGDAIKQFKFERSFDPALALRADRVLERILQGIDVPKDIITGLANVKYSNALQIDETLYKTHIEPLMLLIADAIARIGGAYLGARVVISDNFLGLYLALFAGFLIYLATSHILPEAHSNKPSRMTLLATVAGVVIMFAIVTLVHG
jgi:hypothetical protein